MFGFVYLNPTRLEFSSREFDRCVRDGPIVGIKPLFGELASSPNLDKIIEGAASANAVLFQHTWWKTTGNLPGESTPLDMAELWTHERELGAGLLRCTRLQERLDRSGWIAAASLPNWPR